MKICIVGGTGNISQPIAKLLLEQGQEVVLFNQTCTVCTYLRTGKKDVAHVLN